MLHAGPKDSLGKVYSDPVGRTLNNKPVSSVMRFFSPHRPNTPASA